MDHIDMKEQPPAPAPFPVSVDWGDHNVWNWEAKQKEKWALASDSDCDWQMFMDCWLHQDCAADLHQNSFPYELQIFPQSHFERHRSTIIKVGARPLLHTSNGRMLVLERHAFLYHSLKRNREEDYDGGVVLSGQPGVGKSFLLWYFLVRLIHDRQPVVLHLPGSASVTILFYQGKAWCPRSSDFHFQDLPYGPDDPDTECPRPIFVLVDSAEKVTAGMIDTMGWPIYAMSPKSDCFQDFLKVREPIIWGLDLWTLDQLRHGLELQLRWPKFVEGLNTLLQNGTVTTTAINCVVSLKNEPRYAAWPKETVGEWIEILLDNAIYWGGRTARDVFGTILRPEDIEADVASNPLQDVTFFLARRDFSEYYSVNPISHKILALQMRPQSLISDESSVFDFIIKSSAIQKMLDNNISQSDDATIRSLFNSLRDLPSSSGTMLASHVFAEYALGRMTVANPALPLKPMDFLSGTAAQPTFTAAAENDWTVVPDGVYPPSYTRPSLQFMPTEGVKRYIWYEPNYQYGSLQAGVFYVPVATSHSLFDAFFLEKTNLQISVLWIIKFATSREHKGAARGLLNVQNLLKLARLTIDNEVHVRWVLVTPTPVRNISDLIWQMPPQWDWDAKQNDHRGYVWLQEIDMSDIKRQTTSRG